MSSSSLKNEEKLIDASNFFPWKTRLDITLEEHDVLEYVEGEVSKPTKNSNANMKAKYKKGEVKAKKITLGSLGDHFITYVSNLMKTKEMCDMLIQVNDMSQILASKNQLKDVKMNRGETIQAYFMRISKIKD